MQAVYMKYKHEEFDSVATRNSFPSEGSMQNYRMGNNNIFPTKGIKLNENISDEEVIG